jgi:hypothetical protein
MMTLAQAERLVRKITESLGQPAQEAQAAKLAQDFAEVARAASRRLEQCGLMIEAGEELQALQLAETPPPLLDLLTLLSFRQATEWRNYCQQRGLPWAEPFFDKYIRLLNETYGRGTPSEQPMVTRLMKAYREAMLRGDDERGLSILRVVGRLNPSDQNSAQELKRLEEKSVRARLDALGELLAAADKPAVLAQLAQIEASGLPIPGNHPAWQQAQLLRCEELLEQGHSLKRQNQWQQAEPLVQQIKSLAAQHSVLFPEADVSRFEELEEWTSSERQMFARNQDFQRALDALEYQARSSETKRSSGKPGTVAELQDELDSLSAKRREVERLGALEPELGRRCQRSADWLQAQIRQGAKRKRVRVLALAIGILALLAVGGLVFRDFTAAGQFAGQLERLEAARRVNDTTALLNQIPERLKMKPRLAAGLTRAGQFISAEMDLEKDFEQKLSVLAKTAQNGFTNDFASVEASRAACSNALERVAPEFQSLGQANLRAFQQKWQNYLGGLEPAHNAEFSSKLSEAQRLLAEGLNPTNSLEALRHTIPEAQAAATSLTVLEQQPIRLEENLERQFRRLTNEIYGWSNTITQWAELHARLPRSATLTDYLSSLTLISQSPLAHSHERSCVEELHRLNTDEISLLGGLLLPSQPQAWAALTNAAAPLPAHPDEPTEQEKAACLRLRDDRNMQDIYMYELTNNPSNTNNPGKRKPILSQGPLAQNRAGKKYGMIYDVKNSPDALRFEQQVIDDWEWDYNRIEKKGVFGDCDAFKRLGLGDLIDPNTGRYQRSMLELLDRVGQDISASATFRAYITLRLLEIAKFRPVEWGLPWCPAVALREQKLNELGAGNLQSGDWMVPNQLAYYEPLFKKLFEQTRGLSMDKEAHFYYWLTSKACEAKFAFAGYIDPEGQTVFTRTNTDWTECWGWSARSRTPALVLVHSESGWKTTEPVLCYSPLFIFLGDRRQLFEQAAQSVPYTVQPSNALPPLFGGLR